MPNVAGLERAIAAGLTEVAIFASSTETFSRKNINKSIGESLVTYADVGKARARLGYAPSVALEEGLARFVAWYREENRVRRV